VVLVGSREGEGRKPLYFASVDMERCYDNIHVHQLLDIVAGKPKLRQRSVDRLSVTC
jgi:hypothetical protein